MVNLLAYLTAPYAPYLIAPVGILVGKAALMLLILFLNLYWSMEGMQKFTDNFSNKIPTELRVFDQ